MAPPYKKIHKKTGTRNYKAYGDRIMNLCIQEIKNKKLTQRQASLKYKIPRSSITLRLKALREARVQSPGRQCIFLPFEEKAFVDHAITMYKCGFPISLYDLRCIVKMYLDSQGRVEPRFNDNLPGKCWANNFLERHKEELSHLFCRNVEPAKVNLNENVISSFFSYLENEIKDVPPNLIYNYDEASLVDDPSKKRVLSKRGCKYPEALKNSTKAAVSIMICGNAAGEVCPPYVNYKAEKMSDSWTIGGPPNTGYNRSDSGWFDSSSFEDWFFTIVLPNLIGEDGKKILIGDNLSSHLSFRVLRACEEHDITFISLPPNSTHLMQPLHIAYFQAFQWHWRQILDEWKETPEGQTTPTVPKSTFPSLLNELWYKVIVSSEANLLAGFKKAGIFPLNGKEVLHYLPSRYKSNVTAPDTSVVTDTIIKYIKMNSKQVGQTPIKRRRKNLAAVPSTNLAIVPSSNLAVVPSTNLDVVPRTNLDVVPSTSISEEDMDTVTMPHVIYLKQ